MPGRAVTEAARELETFTYESALLANSICNDVTNLLSSSNLRPSKDASLTALAQVAALRLNASRALISLFDRQYQHVIAEATQGLRIWDGPPSEKLWLCGTAIPRSSGLCENVLHPSDPDSPLRDSRAARLPVTVVDNLAEHDEFRDQWYCQGWPNNRFYAGVPIRSRRGINIGVLCVLDDKPRRGISDTSVQVLQDLSDAILQHLEIRRSGDAHRPGHRMLRGMGSYVEGRATMSDWENQASITSQDMQAADGEGILNKAQQDLQRERDSLSEINFADVTEPLDRLPAPISPSKVTHEPYFSIAAGSAPTTTTTAKTPPAPDQDERGGQIQQIFSRAANILRESVEVEGVLFLGAGTSFTGSTNPGISKHRQSQSGPLSSSSDSEENPRAHSTSRQSDSVETVCDVIGFSTSKSSSIDAADPRQSHQIVPQRFLQRLLRRYPGGKIFNFDGQGSIIPSDGSSSEEGSARAGTAQNQDPGDNMNALGLKEQSPKREKTIRYRENESKTITSLFPGVRSLCFIPLWDSHRRRWFAGGFVYTMTPFRVFTLQGELSYLSAFAAVIMSDVALMESSLATSAVSSLLNSLSHELRSPLHGIVLCTELLHDTSLDVFQGDMLRSLETCGRTLLDTINHLLDWTKINNFIKGPEENPASQNQRMLRGGRKSSAADGIMHLTSHLELDCLIEEVVECIHAGHTYQQLAAQQGTQADASSYAHARLDAADDLSNTDPPFQRHSDPLIIMLDIEPMLEWTFEAQAGALRRIILNICSNALRYTDRGFIKIVAYQEPYDQSASPSRIIHIDFVDTGRGMGSDYLGQSLFNPFSKEHANSSGAGLGLSLVQKFIKALGGTIRVHSELNRGTKVSVKLPLKASTGSGAAAAHSRDDFGAQVTELSRLRVCLIGFPTAQKSLLGSATGGTEAFDEEALLSKICQDWLTMDIVGFGQDEEFMPDLILCDESAASKLNHRTELSSPVIIVCRNPAAARDLERAHMKHKLTRSLYSFISRPVGPRKLAKAFVLCFRRWTRLQARVAEEGHSIATSFGEELSTVEDNVQQASRQVDEADTTYCDTLPQVAPPLQPASDNDPNLRSLTPTPTSKANRFLLVEDNAINMKILKMYMKKLGKAFDTAADGRQAVNMYKSSGGRYDCVLMDISMPVMDGFEATRLIREFEQERQLGRSHIVAITGLASRDAQEEALATGLDLFLSKPVKLKELSRLLKERGLV